MVWDGITHVLTSQDTNLLALLAFAAEGKERSDRQQVAAPYFSNLGALRLGLKSR